MRFFNLAFVGLAPLCLATPAPVFSDSLAELAERGSDGTNVVLKAFAAIRNRTLILNESILNINTSDLGQQLPLAGYANDIIVTITNETSKVKAAGNIPYGCVINVASKAQALIDVVAKTLANLKSKKIYTDESTATPIVVDILEEFPPVVDKFIKALKPKVPSSVQFLVNGDKRQLDLLFSDAIIYFSQPPATSTA